jgi:hypothetical protein
VGSALGEAVGLTVGGAKETSTDELIWFMLADVKIDVDDNTVEIDPVEWNVMLFWLSPAWLPKKADDATDRWDADRVTEGDENFTDAPEFAIKDIIWDALLCASEVGGNELSCDGMLADSFVLVSTVEVKKCTETLLRWKLCWNDACWDKNDDCIVEITEMLCRTDVDCGAKLPDETDCDEENPALADEAELLCCAENADSDDADPDENPIELIATILEGAEWIDRSDSDCNGCDEKREDSENDIVDFVELILPDVADTRNDFENSWEGSTNELEDGAVLKLLVDSGEVELKKLKTDPWTLEVEAADFEEDAADPKVLKLPVTEVEVVLRTPDEEEPDETDLADKMLMVENSLVDNVDCALENVVAEVELPDCNMLKLPIFDVTERELSEPITRLVLPVDVDAALEWTADFPDVEVETSLCESAENECVDRIDEDWTDGDEDEIDRMALKLSVDSPECTLCTADECDVLIDPKALKLGTVDSESPPEIEPEDTDWTVEWPTDELELVDPSVLKLWTAELENAPEIDVVGTDWTVDWASDKPVDSCENDCWNDCDRTALKLGPTNDKDVSAEKGTLTAETLSSENIDEGARFDSDIESEGIMMDVLNDFKPLKLPAIDADGTLGSADIADKDKLNAVRLEGVEWTFENDIDRTVDRPVEGSLDAVDAVDADAVEPTVSLTWNDWNDWNNCDSAADMLAAEWRPLKLAEFERNSLDSENVDNLVDKRSDELNIVDCRPDALNLVDCPLPRDCALPGDCELLNNTDACMLGRGTDGPTGSVNAGSEEDSMRMLNDRGVVMTTLAIEIELNCENPFDIPWLNEWVGGPTGGPTGVATDTA